MKFLINFVLGITFGFGLILSNIFDPTTVTLFLQLGDEWNPSILLTLGGIIVFSLVFLNLVNFKTSHTSNQFFLNQETNLNHKVVLGSALFGIGWGLSGLCVSTAAMNLAFNKFESILFFLFMFLGFYGPKLFKKIML